MSDIRAMHERDLDPVVALLYTAFRDDPFTAWLVPDVADRDELMPLYFRHAVRTAMTPGVGEVHVTDDLTAVAVWLHHAATAIEQQPQALPAALHNRFGDYAVRVQAMEDLFHYLRPAGPAHHHLALVAVEPESQGLRIGTRLLRAHLSDLDQLGRCASLDASTIRSRKLYHRLGFTDVQQVWLSVGDEPQGPPVFAMWRKPRTTT